MYLLVYTLCTPSPSTGEITTTELNVSGSSPAATRWQTGQVDLWWMNYYKDWTLNEQTPVAQWCYQTTKPEDDDRCWPAGAAMSLGAPRPLPEWGNGLGGDCPRGDHRRPWGNKPMTTAFTQTPTTLLHFNDLSSRSFETSDSLLNRWINVEFRVDWRILLHWNHDK